jgi:hypothetical protein
MKRTVVVMALVSFARITNLATALPPAQAKPGVLKIVLALREGGD